MLARLAMLLGEEETSTPVNLIKIGSFAAIAFLFMTLLVDSKSRLFVGGIGALIILMLIIVAAWLRFQERFGAARLLAETPFVYGQQFQGVIDTELPAVPNAPVRIALSGRRVESSSEGGSTVIFNLSSEVPPQQFTKTDAGAPRIPFAFMVPGDDRARTATQVRLYVRTRRWPLGWGATFLVVSS